MKRTTFILALLSLASMAAYVCAPVVALADDPPPAPNLPPVLIAEVQAGSGASASEEFIELHNASTVPIDFSAHEWQLQIASSTASDWDSPLRTITLSGTLAPGQSYIVASQYTSGGQTVQYLAGSASLWFGAGIAAGAGHIRLVYATDQQLSDTACVTVQTVVDQVEWSAPKDGAAATPSIDGRPVFLTAKSTGLANGTSLQRLTDPLTTGYRDTDDDAADFAVAAATPGTLSVVSAASSATNTSLQPGVPADDCDPSPPENPADPGGGTEPDGSDEEPAEEPGSGEEPDPILPPANEGLLAPILSELLPNPGAPQTDAADEYVELYNPNSAQFDLSGFMLEAGTSSKRRYVFPAGTILPPNAYAAFFSAATGLSLSNSGGQVRLLDPLGTVLSASDIYGAAKDNQAWTLSAGKWQWTLTPTPNAPNAVLLPAVKAKAAKASSAKKSTKSAKTSAAKQKSQKKEETTAGTQVLAADTATSRYPLHPGVLAAIGVLAVLYGAYEYRQDMANYVRRARDYRAARREDRQALTGRGSD